MRITGIEPVVLIEGELAAIHGTGFSTVASENRVTIGGLDVHRLLGHGHPPHPDRSAGGVPSSEARPPPRLECVGHGLEERGRHTPAGGCRPARRRVPLHIRRQRLPSSPGERRGRGILDWRSLDVGSPVLAHAGLPRRDSGGCERGGRPLGRRSTAGSRHSDRGRRRAGRLKRRGRGTASIQAARVTRAPPGMDHRAAGGRSTAQGGGGSGAGSSSAALPRLPHRARSSARTALGERVTLWAGSRRELHDRDPGRGRRPVRRDPHRLAGRSRQPERDVQRRGVRRPGRLLRVTSPARP